MPLWYSNIRATRVFNGMGLCKRCSYSIFLLILPLAISGCLKKPAGNINTKINIQKNINTSKNPTSLSSPTPTPSPSPTDTPVEVITSDIDTSNWLTYRNEKYGFEVKHPEGWRVDTSDKGQITVSYPDWRDDVPEGGRAVLISVKNIRLKDFVHQYNEEYSYIDASGQKQYVVEDAMQEKGTVLLNGAEAVYLSAFTAIGLPESYLFIKRNELSYILRYDDYDEVHKGIISTFRFFNKLQ